MDSIDITDSAFSLDVPSVNGLISSTEGSLSNDYMMYVYIGLAALVLLGGIYIFKKYQNIKNDNSIDCEGGFCMMNQNQNAFS